MLGRRDASDPRPDVWPLPFGAATALALTFFVWRFAFRTLFVAVHQAYPVVAWYVVPMGIVINLSLLFGPRVAGAMLAERAPALLPRAGVIAAALSGLVAALALYGGIALMNATHQVVPATPAGALPFACLTGAAGAALGHTVAIRVRESVRLSAATATESTPRELAPAGSKQRGAALGSIRRKPRQRPHRRAEYAASRMPETPPPRTKTRWRAAPATLHRRAPTVRREDGPRHVAGARRREESDHLCDSSSGPAARLSSVVAASALTCSRLTSSSNTGPGEIVFTRTPLRLNPAAQARVSEAMAPFVAP